MVDGFLARWSSRPSPGTTPGVPGARDARATTIAFTGLITLLDLVVVAGLIQRSPAMFRSIGGTWIPLLLVFLATWATGEIVSTLPPPTAPRRPGPILPAPARG